MDVMIPAIPMDSPLIAPSTSPISIALDVPIAWDAVPKAAPTATESVILHSRRTKGPSIFPVIPVNTITETVRAGNPPIFRETSIPIGVVILLGNILNISSLSIPNSFEKK